MHLATSTAMLMLLTGARHFFFQTDTFSAPFGNTTVVGAPIAQPDADEFGATAGMH